MTYRGSAIAFFVLALAMLRPPLMLQDVDRHAVCEFALDEKGEASQDETIVWPLVLGDRNPYPATSN